MLVQCEWCDAHQAIYRTLNQLVVTRLRIGVYVFDHDGCQYPDRTMCSKPVGTRLFYSNSRVNISVLHPIYIDAKEEQARIVDRLHNSRVQGGYPIARLVGTTDIPRYLEITKPSKPSTRDEPSGLVAWGNVLSSRQAALSSTNIHD